MGQTISYPPFDVVVYLTKFLWFDDIHSLTAVNHTLHLMLEGESDLWPWLLTSALQRVVSLPFPLLLGRVGVPETKALIRRTCDHPTAVDAHILRKYKGPQNVVLEAPAAPRGRRNGSLAVTVRFEPKTSDDSHSFPSAQVPVTKRSVVSNNCFPCLAASARVPNALLPFAKVMAVTPHCMSGTSNHRNAAPFLHTATLSCIAYFEGTISLPTKSPESDNIHQSTVYSIGIAAAPFPVSSKLPGEDHYSFGYVSKSGHVISRSNRTCSGSGLPYGEGDTVGCGLIYPLVEGTPGHMIFTKNGEIQHKVPILANDMKTFFSIAWFPVMVSQRDLWCMYRRFCFINVITIAGCCDCWLLVNIYEFWHRISFYVRHICV